MAADRFNAVERSRVVGREVLIETRVLRTRISLKFPAALATNWTRCPGSWCHAIRRSRRLQRGVRRL